MLKDEILLAAQLQSLHKEIAKNTNLINEEKNRLDFLGKQKEKRIHESSEKKANLAEIKLQLTQLEKKLAETEKKADQAEQAWNAASTESAAEKAEQSFKIFQVEKDELSEQILDLLGSEESTIHEISTDEEFIAGIDETLMEVEKEIEHTIKPYEEEIQVLKKRVDHIYENLSSDIKRQVDASIKKCGPEKFMSRVEQGSCLVCRFVVDTAFATAADKGETILACGGCGRFFAPYF